MFRVECPKCRAPYQVDERRVPATGVSMKCPKCSNRFVVHPPADPASLPQTRTGTIAGTSPQRLRTDSTTMIGVAAPVAPKAPPTPAGESTAALPARLGVRNPSMKGTLLGVAVPSDPPTTDPPPLSSTSGSNPALELDEAELPGLASDAPALPSVAPPARPVAAVRPVAAEPAAPPKRTVPRPTASTEAQLPRVAPPRRVPLPGAGEPALPDLPPARKPTPEPEEPALPSLAPRRAATGESDEMSFASLNSAPPPRKAATDETSFADLNSQPPPAILEEVEEDDGAASFNADLPVPTGSSYDNLSFGDSDPDLPAQVQTGDSASFGDLDLGDSLPAIPAAKATGTSLPGLELEPEATSRGPAVPHPATQRRPAVSIKPEAPPEGELPLPEEPESAPGELHQEMPLKVGTEPDLGFGAGSIELPSPAADFDEELLADDPDVGDFSLVDEEPAPARPAPPRPVQPRVSEMGDKPAPPKVPRPAGFGTPSASLPPLTSASLPSLPDLDAVASSRRMPAVNESQGLPTESQAFSAFSTDAFRLDSAPPSRAASSKSLQAMRGQPAASSAGDDAFFDEEDEDAFSTGSKGGHDMGMPASSMVGGLSLSEDDEAVEADEFGDRAGQYGEVNLGGGADSREFGEAAISPRTGGGTEHGTVDLGARDSDFPEADEGAEFGAIPQEKDDDVPASTGFDLTDAPPRSAVAAGVEKINPSDVKRAAPKPKKKRLWPKLLLAGVLLTAIAGGSLALVPSLGPFGINKITDLLNREQHQALLLQTANRLLDVRKRDDFTLSADVVSLCKRSQADAPRLQALTALCAFTQYSWVVRFPGQADLEAGGKVLLDQLQREGAGPEVPYLEQAQAAQSIVAGDFPGAKRVLDRLGNTPEVFALRGELALLEGNLDAAKTAWTSAVERAPSTWTLYGLTRTLFRSKDFAGAKAQAEQALVQQPQHVGAKLVLAEIAFTSADEKQAVEWVDKVLATPNLLSPQEVIDAHSLLGEIHLDRGRISRAETEFALALKVDPKALRPLMGLAKTFSTAGRHAAALARYTAAAEDPLAPMEARLGMVRSHIELERNDKAKEAIAPLLKSDAEHPEVLFWAGRLALSSGKLDVAEKSFRLAIEKGGEQPIAVSATVGLAELMSKGGKLEDAEKLLSEAQKKFPKSAALRNNLGQVALTQGRYEVALLEFQQARALDPGDVTALFNEGSALRRLRRHEEAWKAFDEVAKLDKDLPGLPLERGLLLEQSGRGGEALAEYEKALAKDPNDPDLKLRVGCARVSAGQGKEAAPLLEEVVKKRSRSSEALHCLGRALFLQGQGMLAMKRLQQAIELDPTRAEYHLYVGWVANDSGQIALAKRALNDALKLDKGLGDAYWQRGRLSLRQGGPGDAIPDLKRALTLRPSRYEAHADLAQAYYQMGRRDEALREWPLAIAQEGDNAVWLFRYGKVLHSEHMNSEAARHLEKAIKLASKEELPPAWLWEAHHLLAASLPPGKKAIEHWKRFLDLGPPDSPYRTDAFAALREAGEVWQPPGLE